VEKRMPTEYVISVDIGGTATDCVVRDEEGTLTVGKAFSTPPTFVEGVLNAIEVVARKLGISVPVLLKSTKLFLHSTTIADNAIATHTLAKAGLLVTKGCEDILFMMRGAYGRWSGLTEEEIKNPLETDKPPALIPFSFIKGITERTDIRGRVLVAPAAEEVQSTIQDLVERGVEGVGVCFLCSFSNAENEQMVEHIVQRLHPELYFTLSSEISPIVGEYERTSTVALNVSLGPFVSRYLTDLRAALETTGFHGALLIMQAYGGLLRTEEASRQPVGMIESGPVGGLVGSKYLGEGLGFGNIVAADMGGTTFKVGVIRESRIDYQRAPMVLRYHYALPKMDVVSIGLAGSSIISLDSRTHTPRIGPASAGAHPGPVCYGFGGTQPTLTDVDLILGYLHADFFLEGNATLDYESALQAFSAQIADPLKMDAREAAGAIYKLSNSFLYDLLHKMTVQKGLDPREYVLFSYGGTAGMHLGAVAQELRMQQAVIPYAASVQGAYGLSVADVVHEYQVTQPMSWPGHAATVDEIFGTLRAKTKEQLQSEGFAEPDILVHQSIDVRYKHQIHELSVPVEVQAGIGESDLTRVGHTFTRLYEERYGKDSGHSEGGIEMVTFRVRGTGILRRPHLREYESAGPDPIAGFVEARQISIHTEQFKGIVTANGYDFEKLFPGNEIIGPAIIWSPITTVLVHPEQRARLDRYKNIVLTW
jgi:N-methylhydantoinase A